MAREKTHWYWVLDGAFAVYLLDQYEIPYLVKATKRKSGIEIGVEERYTLSMRDVFTSASVEYKEV